MDVTGLDHLVLTVASIEASADWYGRVLGMTHEVDDDRHSLHFGDQKINLHEVGHTFDPKAERPTPGSGDLCFRTSSAVEEVLRHLDDSGVVVEEGPVGRRGARGPMTSAYVRDPDRNLIEIAHYDL